MGLSMKTTSGKILASVALVGTAAAVAGMGTYGAFTSTTNASHSVTSGTVVIALNNGASNTLSVPVTGLLPGDSVEKIATLSNTGNSALNNITLTTSTTTPSLLTTNTTDGLQLTVESCSVAWTVAAGVDTCSGTTTTVLATSPVVGANRPLAGLAALASGSADYLKVTTTLPTTAGNTFQGAASTIAFDFTGTQRTGEVK
ncbi:TasA family protein [Pseudarthrobacter sp. AL07]|uniref:TasA family protein n=1 Tax=unclassified Pseudarthrobacter TaxID=2647000 RepID=UPI00249A816F|nr:MULTISPECIES: TasA family protein [unclassified Pseudarthrobacter]MDI3193571.1 TasA family protein [Pseudarthrobacter sp. AL20]MDI3207919.1 TasA family protein [Pseudarthrobacter sp. AL07]